MQATQGGWIKAQTIESGRIAAQQYVRGEGRLYIRIFPHKSITVDARWKPAWVTGKGEPEHWVAVVKPGTMLFELGGVTEQQAKLCFARLAHKMPVRVRMVEAAAGVVVNELRVESRDESMP